METLAKLWASRRSVPIGPSRWSVRRAKGGTIVVSEEGDNEVELVADTALLGPAGITLGGLSAGVSFGAERKATWKVSAPAANLVIWARLYKLDPATKQAVDAFGFEPGSRALEAQIATIKPIAYPTDDVLVQLAQ